MRRLLPFAIIISSCADVPDHDDPRDPRENFDPTSCTNLLADGDFDDPTIGWAGTTQVIIDDHHVPNMLPIVADSGHFFAWLGGQVTAYLSIEQLIQIPAGVGMLRLDARLYVASQMSDPDGDYLKISLDSTDVVTLTNKDATDPNATSVVWKPMQVIIPTNGAQQAEFTLESWNDENNNTNFFLDTFSLLPSSCP